MGLLSLPSLPNVVIARKPLVPHVPQRPHWGRLLRVTRFS